MGIGELYRETRLRITDVLREAGDGTTPVPACPDWTVKDVVAHLAGVCHDILAGNLDGVGTDPWTAAQVEARSGASLADVVAEWDEKGPQVEAIADVFPPGPGTQFIADTTTHEHDVRGALGRPGARDSEGVSVGLPFLVAGLGRSIDGRGLPGLVVRTPRGEWMAGEREPGATVAAEPFELLRALTGRRSLDQIRALFSDGDPAPYLPAFRFGPFRPRPTPLDE